MQRAIKTTPYQMVFRREIKRYQVLPIAIRERTQIKEEPIEENPFDISDAEEQPLLEQVVSIKKSSYKLFELKNS